MRYDGLSQAELAERLGARSCLTLPRVTSALDIIHELAGEDAPAGTVVVADEQVAGRGRFGRHWYSPAKSGIWMGYLMRPTGNLESGVLALRVGIAIASSLEQIGVDVQLKWPNDIMLRGRKLGGVLCEARWMNETLRWIAVGVGLNVAGTVPHGIAPHAVSLSEVLPHIRRVEVLVELVPRLNAMTDAPVLGDEEREMYSSRDWLRDKKLREPVIGRATGIDPDGALLVRVNGRVRRVVGGSVVTE
jgi:BirA family biotin operon repressor/biotin-[acetyl-CoA-carboxylase] ligase